VHDLFKIALLGNSIYDLVNFGLSIKVYKHVSHNYVGLYYRF